MKAIESLMIKHRVCSPGEHDKCLLGDFVWAIFNMQPSKGFERFFGVSSLY